jgi:hypothetical protein
VSLFNTDFLLSSPSRLYVLPTAAGVVHYVAFDCLCTVLHTQSYRIKIKLIPPSLFFPDCNQKHRNFFMPNMTDLGYLSWISEYTNAVDIIRPTFFQQLLATMGAVAVWNGCLCVCIFSTKRHILQEHKSCFRRHCSLSYQFETYC